jgi:hypothetical protein
VRSRAASAHAIAIPPQRTCRHQDRCLRGAKSCCSNAARCRQRDVRQSFVRIIAKGDAAPLATADTFDASSTALTAMLLVAFSTVLVLRQCTRTVPSVRGTIPRTRSLRVALRARCRSPAPGSLG